ncbi:MAG TPA: hypothetical protein VL992_10910, partial [Tepidisphaeraceae bacterium]|nr:hypothetical protein [Tepidisphaeraceae bacterium]
MDSQIKQSFNCTACGKAIKWTAAIAGKMGKCKCGATIQVPKSIDPPAAEDDFLYGVEPTIAPESIAPPRVSRPVSGPEVPVVEPESDSVVADEPINDYYHEVQIPLGVLAAGAAGMLGWAAFHGLNLVGAAIVGGMIAGAVMVVKTVVLTFMAWSLARRSGGSLGYFWTTVLKIAALVLILDAATLWTWTIMEQTGAITPHGQFYIGKTILIMFLATLVVAALIVQFLFGLYGDEANLFSRFVAGGNLGLNVLLIITLIIIGHAVRNAANQTAAATP